MAANLNSTTNDKAPSLIPRIGRNSLNLLISVTAVLEKKKKWFRLQRSNMRRYIHPEHVILGTGDGMVCSCLFPHVSFFVVACCFWLSCPLCRLSRPVQATRARCLFVIPGLWSRPCALPAVAGRFRRKRSIPVLGQCALEQREPWTNEHLDAGHGIDKMGGLRECGVKTFIPRAHSIFLARWGQ